MHNQYTTEGASREMPRYKSHKIVWALKIKAIEIQKASEYPMLLMPEEPGYAPVKVSGGWINKHNPQTGGYYVVYEDGYTSWSPAEAFEKGYTAVDTFIAVETSWAGSFQAALTHLKQGGRAARSGWNGKGMFVFLVPGSTFAVSRAPLLGIFSEGTPIDYRPHIDIKGVDGAISTWVPSIGDVLADDWLTLD